MSQATLLFGQAHDDAEMLFTFPEFSRGFSGKADLNDIFDIANIQAVSRGAFAIDFDKGLGHFAGAVDGASLNARHIGDGFEDLGSFVAEPGGVITEDLDDDLPIDLGDALEDIITDGLRETGSNAGQSVEI